jgi:Flp pilus assembly protein TadB
VDWFQAFLLFVELGTIAVAALLWAHVQDAKEQARKALQELNDHRVEVAREYVTNDRLEQVFGDVKASLNRIENKLDGKADK